MNEYLLAWIVYLLAAVGCLAVWWKITSKIPSATAGWLRLWATVLVVTPGTSKAELSTIVPNLLGSIYDALTFGPEAITENLLILLLALAASSLIKKLVSGKTTSKPGSRNISGNSKKSERRTQRTEPKLP